MWMQLFFSYYASFLDTYIFLFKDKSFFLRHFFWFPSFSREVESENPILYNMIPFESIVCLDAQQNKLFQLYSEIDSWYWKKRGGRG